MRPMPSRRPYSAHAIGHGPPCARQVEQRTPRQGQFATGMVWLFARQAQHGQAQRLQYRPDPQQRPPRTMHVRIRVFRIRLAYRKVRIDAAFLIFNRLAVFGTHAFKSCPPMGDSRLRDHHHTATAQADAPAQVRGFGERAEPWIGTLPSTQGGQWNQRAGKRHSQHILPAIILFLIRLTVHHQRRDIVVPRIQTDVMQLSACQSNCFAPSKDAVGVFFQASSNTSRHDSSAGLESSCNVHRAPTRSSRSICCIARATAFMNEEAPFTPTRMTRMVLLSGTSVSTPAGDGITLNVICIAAQPDWCNPQR